MATKRFMQNWDAPGIYRDILVAFLDELKPSANVVKKIVDDMSQRGYQFTYRGLDQHLQKLRRTTTTEPGAASASSTPKAPRTPKTPKAKATPKSGTKRKNVKTEAEDGDGDTNADDICPAAKKMKKEQDESDLSVTNE
ncbi:hypothetical protein SBRCBS47491_003082 [Sporothrix bragantina]|uniref:Uncharacterized protein n=1 Tax=Sporothrix bragantina TaxID=671064 RepID=A0ABP0BC35_9PEZI